jgi:hypothetical protein
MRYLPGFSVAGTGAEFSMFTFIGLECSAADRAGEFDLRTALNYSRMLCPPQLSAFITAEFFHLAMRCLRNLRMALQAETDIFAWLIGRLNVMSLAKGFYRICRNTELLCNRMNWYTAFTQFGYDLFLLFRHLDHILVNKKERAEKRLCP